MTRLVFIFSILTALILCQYNVKAPESLIFAENSLINTDYTADISRNIIYVYQFNVPANIPNIAVQTRVLSGNLSALVFIYGEYESYIESWRLPFTYKQYPRNILTRSSKTACPQLNQNQTAANQDISIRFQTFASQSIRFSLRVSSVESNILQLGTEATTSISPSFPQYFVHDIPDNLMFLEIQLTSPTELCALVRFTNYSCPPDFTQRSNRAVTGFELTMLTLADLRVRRSDFADGRIMILLIPIPAAECETTLEYDVNATSEYFEKNITIVVKSGNTAFWGPVLISVVIFIIPYIILAILVLFDLILGYFYPKFSKHFAIFSSARRYSDEATAKESDKSEKESYVELGELTQKHQDPKIECELWSGENIFVAYKNGLLTGTLTSKVESLYYYNLINTREINLSDLHLKPEREAKVTSAIYPFTVIIIGLFYAIPAFQVAYVNHKKLVTTGLLDTCYINLKCDRNVGSLRAFNAIWSNIGYILLSVLFFIITLIKNIVFASEVKTEGLPTKGIPYIFSLYYAMALALFFEGILSSFYHACPSLANFQFDTTFQYIFLILLYVRLYQNRHTDTKMWPTHVFYLISLSVLLTSLSLIEADLTNYPARIVLTLAFIITLGVLFYLIYCLFIPQLPLLYHRDWKENKNTVQILKKIFWPRYNKSRFFQMLCLIVAGFVILMVIWTPGAVRTVATGILPGITVNILFYYIYYWIMKIANREFVHRPVVFATALAIAVVSIVCWAFAFYFWSVLRVNWNVSPSLAREGLRDCIFLDFFDHHDVWHILSSFGIFTLYLSTLLVDENLSSIPQNKIRVF